MTIIMTFSTVLNCIFIDHYDNLAVALLFEKNSSNVQF